MRKKALFVALAVLAFSIPVPASAEPPECETTGWWWFKQTTCTYHHGEGAIVIKTDYKGNVTSVERMPY